MRIRLLNVRVCRGTAWRIADRVGWEDIAGAEHRLQADALVASTRAWPSAPGSTCGSARSTPSSPARDGGP